MSELAARPLFAGEATGPLLVLDEPLSFWGGVDPATGEVIDRRHPQSGAAVAGTVLVMRSGRGSSSATTVLAEAIRRGTGPAAIVLGEPDEMLLVGAMVAAELYGTVCPVVVADEGFEQLRSGATAVVHASGRVTY